MRIPLEPNLEALTGAILNAAFEVSSSLGHGFLEAVYHNALLHELGERGIAVQSKASLDIVYKGRSVGVYQADMIVGEFVIVEMKAVENLSPAHVGQTLNYLRASNLTVGLLLNFGTPRLQFRRVLLHEKHPCSSV